MKPLYILLILYAVFITGLADGLEFGFMAIPAVGIVIGLAISFCINITMGAGLLLLLVKEKMFHPKFGPFGVVLGLIPGLNSLPVWVGLVIAGILQKVAEEESGLLGTLAKVGTAAGSLLSGSPFAAVETAGTIAHTLPNTQQPRTSDTNTREEGRVPLNLKSPRINTDIRHVQKAA